MDTEAEKNRDERTSRGHSTPTPCSRQDHPLYTIYGKEKLLQLKMYYRKKHFTIIVNLIIGFVKNLILNHNF